MGASIAGAFAGLVFTLCGFNKLFQPVRRMEMLLTMGRVFGSAHKVKMWVFVSMAELYFGFMLVISSLAGVDTWMVVSALPLLVICIVGYVTQAHRNMLRTWDPRDPLDWLACVMWTSEVQLATLCIIAMT